MPPKVADHLAHLLARSHSLTVRVVNELHVKKLVKEGVYGDGVGLRLGFGVGWVGHFVTFLPLWKVWNMWNVFLYSVYSVFSGVVQTQLQRCKIYMFL